MCWLTHRVFTHEHSAPTIRVNTVITAIGVEDCEYSGVKRPPVTIETDNHSLRFKGTTDYDGNRPLGDSGPDRVAPGVARVVPVDQWHAVIGDPSVADAILDRLVHHAHRLELKGESMRRVKNRPAAQEES